MNTINNILESISSLSEEEQFFVADIISKRIHDLKRTKIVLRAKEAEKNYETGKFASGNVNDLMKMLK
ncbi:hypothetical protein QUF74_12755 [Candidatus Halobeggiatoa sp. HSG11]|nr:hypothetical protein [Candidatus Halobeggiatoa sp. HSG11]